MGVLRAIPSLAGLTFCSLAALVQPLPPDAAYRPLPTQPLDVIREMDEAAKPEVMQRQAVLLEQRYDLSERAIPGVMMSGRRKPVQDGVRVKLPEGVTWDQLAAMSPGEIREQAPLPEGFKPLPHAAMLEQLESMSGAAFDETYIRGQVADHQKTVQLLEYELGSGQDVDLKSFAEETLPIVLQHLEMAQAIQAELTGAAP